MGNLETATVLLEQAITSLEMVHSFGDDMSPLDRLIVRVMRKITTAQEIIESAL